MADRRPPTLRMSVNPHPIRSLLPMARVPRHPPRHAVVRGVMLALVAAVVLGTVVLTLRQDRRAAIAQEQANAVKVAEGVQLFAGEVLGQAVDSLRELRRALAVRADDEADRSPARLIGIASRHDHGALALGLRSAPGAWLAAAREGPLALGPEVVAALEEGFRSAVPGGPQFLPAVLVPGLDWCVPVRLSAVEEADVGPSGLLVALVPVRRLVATSSSIRLVAGGQLMFATPTGTSLFRYVEETGRVDADRTPVDPVALDHWRRGTSGTFALAQAGAGQSTHLSFSASRKLPLVVTVAVSEPLVGQAWLRRSPGLVLCLLLAGLAALVFAARLHTARSALAQKTSVVRSLSESIAERTTRDPLTGLLDRYAFQRRIQQAIDEHPQRALGVVALDLNRFKEVNESLGHAAGDAILRALSQRLTARFGGGGGCIARLGGDEIALCIALAAGEGAVQSLCGRLYETIAEPLTVSGVSLTLTASLGAAVYPDDSGTPAELLRYAEMAMFEAKRELRPHERYTPALDRFSAESLALRCEFAHALRAGALSLVYQPKVVTASGRLVGVEALTRWKHPTKGFVSPAEFVPLAETTELIHPFTEFVLRSALAQCRAWQRAGHAVPVAVNVSVNNLMDANFVERVRHLLAEHEVPPGRLELEVTESALARNPELALMRLEELRRLGVGLSIDDFGTGYSSLAYLKRLPVDALKLDRSFTHQLATDEGDRRIVESTIRLGHGFGMKVVAEGVETAEIAALLVRLGCDVSQGYFHARPMPAEEFEAKWLARLPQP